MHLQPQNGSLYNSLVQCALQKDLRKGKAVHAQILIAGASSCIYIANSLVNVYAKCGHLPEANLVFENTPNKDVISWNCLINGYSQQGIKGCSFVLELFQRMRADNIFPISHTFSGVFTAASNLSCTFVAEQAHALAIKAGSFCDFYVNNSLLNVYCKAGLLVEARKVFDRMPSKNIVSWATMISGYAFQRLAAEAVGSFVLMRREEKYLNEFVLSSVLSALVVPEFIFSGMQIHCLGMKSGLLAFVSIINALVTMYAKCGNLDYAFWMFEFSTDKNSITWSAMITGYAQSGDSREALKLFSKMHFSGLCPSEYAFVGILNACSDIVAVEEGRQAHSYLLKLGFELQMYIVTALVDMYAKSGCTEDARKQFDYLQKSDTVLWTSMIAGYVTNGENEDALNLYCRMQMNGILPNELTMSSVLKACSSLAALDQGKQIHASAIKHGVSLVLSVGNALSTMYAKCGCPEEVIFAFRRMPVRDTVSWNAIISGLSQNGCDKEALEMFEEMHIEGIKPDHVTFMNVISACSRLGFVDKGWEYFNMMIYEFGLDPRMEHYACMVDVLGRAGKLVEAKEFIESASINHGLSLWRILLSACRNYREYELGAYVGEKLIELGCQESSSYVLLSSIYKALGRREDMERIRSVMNVRRVSKDPGCSWVEVKSRVHVFVVGDQQHPRIEDIHAWIRRLSKQMKHEEHEGYLYQIK